MTNKTALDEVEQARKKDTVNQFPAHWTVEGLPTGFSRSEYDANESGFKCVSMNRAAPVVNTTSSHYTLRRINQVLGPSYSPAVRLRPKQTVRKLGFWHTVLHAIGLK